MPALSLHHPTKELSLLKSFLEALNLSAYSPEDQERILLELSDTLFEGTVVRLIALMDDTTRSLFEELMARDASEEEVSSFLNERVPRAHEAAEETVRAIINSLKTSSEKEA